MNVTISILILIVLTVSVIAGAGTLSTGRTVDAENLVHRPRLSVTALTSYGWTARSALTGYVTC